MRASMVKGASQQCRLCGVDSRPVVNMEEHLKEWHRVAINDTSLLVSLSHLYSSSLQQSSQRQRSKSYSGVMASLRQGKEPFQEISNKPMWKASSPMKILGKENLSYGAIPPMTKTRSGRDSVGSAETSSRPGSSWMEYSQAPGAWAQINHIDSVR